MTAHRGGDRYRIVGERGRGGLGVVYEVHDTALDRRVAMKCCGEHADPVRLVEEARTVAQVRHPNLIEIYDVGVFYDDHANRQIPYFVMELVNGPTLRQHLARRGPMPVRDLIAMARQIASALDALQRAGVVHRDLKSDNIMLDEDGPDPRYVLTDFNIAKRRAGSGTAADAVFGTPETMAPEQWKSSRDVDARADLYSLGVVLFEGATKRLPFHGETLFELMHAHTSVPPPSPLLFRLDLSVAFAALVLRLLAKDPAERPQSAAALLALLDDPALIETPRPIVRVDPPPPPLARRTRRRVVAIVSATVGAIIASIAIAIGADPPVAAGALPAAAPSSVDAAVAPTAEVAPAATPIDAGITVPADATAPKSPRKPRRPSPNPGSARPVIDHVD